MTEGQEQEEVSPGPSPEPTEQPCIPVLDCPGRFGELHLSARMGAGGAASQALLRHLLSITEEGHPSAKILNLAS